MSKKRTTVDPDHTGKLPPQALDLEDAILGAVMLEDEAYHEIADFMRPEMFYSEKNGLVCQAVMNLKNRGESADILTVTQELNRMGAMNVVGGAYAVSKLTDRVASSANIQYHMRIVQQQFIKREAIRCSTELIREAYEESSDPFEVLDLYEKNLAALTNMLFINKASDSAKMHDKVLEHNKALTSKGTAIVGVPTGFFDLDRITGGWRPGNLIILAARPGMGKTAFAIQVGKNAAKAGKPTAIFSLEMTELELYQRLCAQETEMPLDKFTTSGLDEKDMELLQRDTAVMRQSPLYIDDTAHMTIFDIRTKARRLKREKKIELLVVDYLQLVSGGEKSGNREQEVSAISRGLKVLAKELGIPVIALSQLSRQSETRPGTQKIPQLSDLRDSGSIEQDADQVIFIYRPEYYGIEVDDQNRSVRGKAAIIMAKNRGGAIFNTDLRWVGSSTMFKDVVESLPTLNPLAPNTNFYEKETDDLPY